MMNNELDIATCQNARLSRDARFDGKFFTAVLSTGIFCRPICPARAPKPENVRYYLSAEQAQLAGYTPCKRCFPEQAANKSLPSKLQHVVTHFDYRTGTIASITKKFNISTRQLHRLFHQYFGIAPSQYFQQQRLLLARKLITTSSLSLSDVCFASGFNSIRRFNEAIKMCYQCTPNELRKTKLTNENNNCITINLAYRPPFNWPLMLSFFKLRQINSMEHVTDSHYQRNILIDECSGWFSVCQHPNKSALTLTVQLSDFSYLNRVIARVRKMFDLDADMNAIHAQLSQTPQLAKVIEQQPGLRLPGCWDIFEFSIRAILGQQVSVKAATTLAKRIAQQYGSSDPKLPEPLRLVFPTLEQLIDAEFSDIGLTKTRIDTLKRWLRFYHDNGTIFESYQSLATLEKQLCQIKGIGPWTVNYIAMRGLSEPDAFPNADLGIIKALTLNDIAPKPKETLAMSQSWRPWRAYATIYLWHSLH